MTASRLPYFRRPRRDDAGELVGFGEPEPGTVGTQADLFGSPEPMVQFESDRAIYRLADCRRVAVQLDLTETY